MKKKKSSIDPKDLMAVERATTALIGTAISLLVLGFVVEKFELFLNLIPKNTQATNKLASHALENIAIYNYMGIVIISAGIVLALYTYKYYVKWIEHLEKEEIDTDKKIYFLLSIFIALIGIALLATMFIL
ncbi:YidH family protein [Sulfurimonas sp.]